MNNRYRLLIFLIKSSRILIFAWAALILAVYFLLIDTIPVFFYYPFSILLAIAALFLYPFIVTLIMKNQYKQINGILFTDCDPAAYIEIYRHIIDELANTRKPQALDVYRFNLSTGLYAAGRYEEAYELLGRFKSFQNNRMGKLSNAVYYNNLCVVCLKLGRTDEAKYYLDCLAGRVAALSPKDHQKYFKYVNTAQYGVNLAKGVFDNAENFYNEVFYKAVNNYERINSKFCLGKVYLHSDDTAQAKEAFEYVIEHGNKLHIVEEAKEYLKQITK